MKRFNLQVVYTLLKPCFKEPTAHQTSSSPQLQATNEGSKEASTEMKSVVVPLDVTPEQNTVVFSTAPKESLATSNAYIGVSPRKVALDHSNTHTPHVSQTNKPNEDLPMENPRTYTSLIPRQREEMPVYEETNNMASSPPPEDEDIYMNDEEHERYDSIMYEDVSDMNRDEQQEEYVEVGMGGAAEDIDEPEQQYEELKP